jgi:hypothetical protein
VHGWKASYTNQRTNEKREGGGGGSSSLTKGKERKGGFRGRRESLRESTRKTGIIENEGDY